MRSLDGDQAWIQPKCVRALQQIFGVGGAGEICSKFGKRSWNAQMPFTAALNSFGGKVSYHIQHPRRSMIHGDAILMSQNMTLITFLEQCNT